MFGVVTFPDWKDPNEWDEQSERMSEREASEREGEGERAGDREGTWIPGRGGGHAGPLPCCRTVCSGRKEKERLLVVEKESLDSSCSPLHSAATLNWGPVSDKLDAPMGVWGSRRGWRKLSKFPLVKTLRRALRDQDQGCWCGSKSTYHRSKRKKKSKK